MIDLAIAKLISVRLSAPGRHARRALSRNARRRQRRAGKCRHDPSTAPHPRNARPEPPATELARRGGCCADWPCAARRRGIVIYRTRSINACRMASPDKGRDALTRRDDLDKSAIAGNRSGPARRPKMSSDKTPGRSSRKISAKPSLILSSARRVIGIFSSAYPTGILPPPPWLDAFRDPDQPKYQDCIDYKYSAHPEGERHIFINELVKRAVRSGRSACLYHLHGRWSETLLTSSLTAHDRSAWAIASLRFEYRYFP
jgi:hypothetical protein